MTKLPDYRTRSGREAELLAELSGRDLDAKGKGQALADAALIAMFGGAA
jgi:hypothetical protein